MVCVKKKNKSGAYQIAVTIIEAKHLAQNANPMVVVKIGNQKRKTVIRNRTDSPYYDELFWRFSSFSQYKNFYICLLEALSKTQILWRNFIRCWDSVGSTMSSLSTKCKLLAVDNFIALFSYEDHEYYHKWAMLTNPKDPSGIVKGYVRCNIAVHVRNETTVTHIITERDDDIEGNLLLPIGNFSTVSRRKVKYIFTLYRADGLSNKNFGCRCGKTERKINPFIQIFFAGLKGESRWHRKSAIAHFYEKIIFTELFPPLSYRVRIVLKHKVDSWRSIKLATSILNLANLSNPGDYEFLPTFGPSFIHFYNDNSVNCRGCCITKYHALQPPYQGRLLLSLKTQIDDLASPVVSGVDIGSTFSIIEEKLWRIEEYLLVGIIYDASMIKRSRFINKPINFELNIGNAGSHAFPHNIANFDPNQHDIVVERRTDFNSSSTPILTRTTNNEFDYLPIGSDKPCMYVKSWWPNLQWRVSNSNILMFIHQYLKEELLKLETLIAIRSFNIQETYNNIIESLKNYCIRYLHILEKKPFYDDGGNTKLDRHRVNLCSNSVQKIIKMIEINGKLENDSYIKIAMIHAYTYSRELQTISKDPQHAYPDVFVWMMSKNQHVAVTRLPVSEIIFSEELMSRGRQCGRIINMFMNNIDKNFEVDIACKIELFLWFGNMNYIAECWDSIPGGYKVKQTMNVKSLPKTFDYELIWLRAHIFQGYFDSGLDFSGLMDPFIRVVYRQYTAETRSVEQSLSPVWDETLIFPSIHLHGTKESIKSMPSEIVIEAFDLDFCGVKEFFGRTIAVPVVKFKDEPYDLPVFPPKLSWYSFQTNLDFCGRILAAFELVEITENDTSSLLDVKIFSVPNDIRPIMKSHRFEVIFWGVRNLKKQHFLTINKPQIIIECSGVHIKSEIMQNAKSFSNFCNSHVIIEMDLPEQYIYYPPVTIQVYEIKKFGCMKYFGVCIIPTAHIFVEELITRTDYNHQMSKSKSYSSLEDKSQLIIMASSTNSDVEKKTTDQKQLNTKGALIMKLYRATEIITATKTFLFDDSSRDESNNENNKKNEDDGYDWWSKYFASMEKYQKRVRGRRKITSNQNTISTFKIYTSELEMQSDFEGFQDKLTVFELSRGKKTDNLKINTNHYAGLFKGHISIYPWPHPDKNQCLTKNGRNVQSGVLVDYPNRDPLKLIVRIYIVKGINLHPCDSLTGKSDPYLKIKLGKKTINDQRNYIPNQLNPVFAKCFEMEAEFPKDYALTIQVWDWDAASADDLIGETQIDIENRYYSDHRGSCGLSKTYCTEGYNAWRDREKPTQILESLCKRNKLPLPEFLDSGARIGEQKFLFTESSHLIKQTDRRECIALNVLHQWQRYPICGIALVPEHLERRSLFNPRKPGLEQGKLELWVDMFDIDELPPKPPINISPQIPEKYELRVIIWNTEDVPLVENQFLTGEKCSDIYVKGWLMYEDYQKTDVHYNSLTGEGNFNWRFVFRLTYSKSERLMIVKKRWSVFARDETEQKLPCKFHLQVWDSDHFSPDDFLGSLTMDLSRMPRGSANSKNCTLEIVDPSSPTVDLFAIKKSKAWWPFTYLRNEEIIQAGKVEMEITLVPLLEAEEKPVGKGRDPPDPLAPPRRPVTSFSWLRNPWTAFCYIICRYYRWRLMCFTFIFLLILLLGCALYAFPGYLVKRLLGA